jgi:hypothetical protein
VIVRRDVGSVESTYWGAVYEKIIVVAVIEPVARVRGTLGGPAVVYSFRRVEVGFFAGFVFPYHDTIWFVALLIMLERAVL